VANGAVNIFPGNYEDYLWRKQNGAQVLEASMRTSLSQSPAPTLAVVVAEPVVEPKRRVNPMKRKQMVEQLEKVEAAVSSTEAIIAESEEALSRYVSAEETQRVSALLEEKRRSLEALENEWAELSELLEPEE
jgi:ATP-binding cassette subfamily F protein 3